MREKHYFPFKTLNISYPQKSTSLCCSIRCVSLLKKPDCFGSIKAYYGNKIEGECCSEHNFRITPSLNIFIGRMDLNGTCQGELYEYIG